MVLRRLAALALVTATAAACRVGPPRPGDRSLNGEKNLTNSVWMFGFDKFAARQLSQRARGDGLIAVRLVDTDGQAQLELIPDCHVTGRYQYKSMDMVNERLVIKSADDLRAKLPFSYGTFEGEFSQKSELRIEYKSPGDYMAPNGPFQLTGNCSRATHVVTHLTVGAFKSSSSASMNASGGGGLGPAVAGGGTSSSNEEDTAGGNMNACGGLNLFGGGAPFECSMPLKLTLSAINGDAPAPASPGGAMAASAPSANTCSDQGVMANQDQGFSFDGRMFVIEQPQLMKVDAATKFNFACLPNMTLGENIALDSVVTFLRSRPNVRAHVSVYCTVLVPGLDPASADLHKQAIMGKLAAAGVAGRVDFDACVGVGAFGVGNGVSVELVSGCADLTTPAAPKCRK